MQSIAGFAMVDVAAYAYHRAPKRIQEDVALTCSRSYNIKLANHLRQQKWCQMPPAFAKMYMHVEYVKFVSSFGYFDEFVDWSMYFVIHY